jgi:ribosomal protein L33
MSIIVKLVNKETGEFYTTHFNEKPTRTGGKRSPLRKKMYDKKLRKHVWFEMSKKLK